MSSKTHCGANNVYACYLNLLTLCLFKIIRADQIIRDLSTSVVHSQTVDILIDWVQDVATDLVLKFWVADGRLEFGDLFTSGLNQFVESVSTSTNSLTNKSWFLIEVLILSDCGHSIIKWSIIIFIKHSYHVLMNDLFLIHFSLDPFSILKENYYYFLNFINAFRDHFFYELNLIFVYHSVI